MSRAATNTPKFSLEKIEDRLRFVSREGWIELRPEHERAEIWAGTFNSTLPEVFGDRLWHVLHEIMPELAIEVCQASFAEDAWLERLFLAAGFRRDGQLRKWGDSGRDLVVYSILAAEVRYEVTDGRSESRDITASEAHGSLDAGNEKPAERNAP